MKKSKVNKSLLETTNSLDYNPKNFFAGQTSTFAGK